MCVHALQYVYMYVCTVHVKKRFQNVQFRFIKPCCLVPFLTVVLFDFEPVLLHCVEFRFVLFHAISTEVAPRIK